ncbi:hypothetical protein PHSY_007086 [Pseudozyma hubeiensis SY62]|uniref:Stress response protein rds1p n=1 Tax=Pseudozyma hubeiensis (strain SY62) TaxID=1305764 RepID=R9PDN3_PSEHS|nr:hypothetical protein PHSY_007086 [Pseudozyma hubeiensis SY62]GAC99484.1 hypothetical protein PHSY_007086 [Pseudozyma hubeiensis SY62]
MKLSSSFVLAIAAASSASASPLLRRQDPSSSVGGLPTPSAVSSILAGPSNTPTASSDSASASTTSSAATPTATGAATTTFNDTQILQYALTLEHLEAAFYNQSLSNLSTSDFENAGYNASTRNRIYAIGLDEASHVAFLTEALGNQSVPACTYNFSSVTDVASFLTTARVLEGVGVSAYLGAAQNITEKAYLEAAGSILVVEGQHQSYIIGQTNDGGNAIPSAFSTPLDFKQVYSLAAPFIASCPDNATLPLTAFPTLSLTGGAANGSFTPGQQVTVSYDSSNSTSSGSGSNSTYLAIIQGVTGPQFFPLEGNSSQVTLPSNLTGGQMYAVVTTSNSTVTDDNTLAGPAVGYVNIPLAQAPEATAASSGSSSSSAASATASGSAAGGAAPTGASTDSAAPTGAPTDSAATPSATASGSDSIVSTESASQTASQSVAPSLASVGSANLPQPTSSM